MEQATGFLNSIEQMPPAKKLVLIIMGIVVILLILDLLSYYNKQNFFNVLNHSNRPVNKKNIEKMSTTENDMAAAAPSPATPDENTSGMVSINLDPSKINLTLFFAEWCGHCRHFMKETWMDLKEALKDNPEIQLNEVNCTEIRGDIKTPAGKSIEGFPSLILNFKNAKGEYLEDEYRGGRSLNNLTVFLEKFSSFVKTN